MSIPLINNGDLLMNVREKTINPMVNLVNEMNLEVDVVQATVNKFTQDVVNGTSGGKRCIVDYRIFEYSTTGQYAGIGVDLEENEFAVRAVTRNFDPTAKKGEFLPVKSIQYDRKTHTLTADTNGVKTGQLFVEFWKVL